MSYQNHIKIGVYLKAFFFNGFAGVVIFATLKYVCLKTFLRTFGGPTLKTRGNLPTMTWNSHKELKGGMGSFQSKYFHYAKMNF